MNLSIKDARRSEEVGLSSADKGVLQIRTFALFGAKIFGIFESYAMFGEGVQPVPVRAFRTKGGGGGVNISRFCADVFCGRPLNPRDLILLGQALLFRNYET